MFLKEVSLRLHLFDQKYSIRHKFCEILLPIKCYPIESILKCNLFPWCWIFSIISQVFRVTWFFRNHSNMMICSSRNICIIIRYVWCWKQLCSFIFLRTLWYITIQKFGVHIYSFYSARMHWIDQVTVICNVTKEFSHTLALRPILTVN